MKFSAQRRQTYRIKQEQHQFRVQDITRKIIDRQYCMLLFCPQCHEIYHDRNMPINIPFCNHMTCQHCLKKSILFQIKGYQSQRDKPIKINCSSCQGSETFDTIEALANKITYNYEILVQVYEVRPKVAEKAQHLYNLPDEKQKFEVLGVRRFAIDEETKKAEIEEQNLAQKLNKALQLQLRQQRFINNVRTTNLCFKCLKNFNEDKRQPMLLVECQHKVCTQCYENIKDIATNKVHCLFCFMDRSVRKADKALQRWIIIQGQKKKIILKEEIKKIEEIDDLQKSGVNNALQASHSQVANIKFGKVKAKMIQDSGYLPAKHRRRSSVDDMDVYMKSKQKLRYGKLRPQNISDQRDISCQVCSGIYNMYNKPILIQQCPCQSLHLLCERCVKENCLSLSKKDEKKFFISCPISGKKKMYKKNKPVSLDQIYEHYLFNPELPQDKQLHTVMKINQNLLEFIYNNHMAEALNAERDALDEDNHSHEDFKDIDEILSDFGMISDPHSQVVSKYISRSGRQEESKQEEHRDLEAIKPDLRNSKPGISSQLAIFNQQKNCCSCNYDFSLGMRYPCLLQCGHNICQSCVQGRYDKAAKAENEIKITCVYDFQESSYVRPSVLIEGDVEENFENFWNLSVTVNFALVMYLAKSQSSMNKQDVEERKLPFDEEEENDNLQESQLMVNDEEDQEENEEEEEKEDGKTHAVILYDIECPICLLCYSKENPPINLKCDQHPDHPFIMCKNEMMFYYQKCGDDKDMEVSCPICHNMIMFKTLGKPEKDVMKLFEVNVSLLSQIYQDQECREYAEKEIQDLHLASHQ